MKFILLTITFALLSSCGFNSSDEDKGGGAERSTQNLNTLQANNDSDGDLVNDKEEAELGRNPFVADLPKIKAQFLQDYRIKVLFQDESVFEINTETAKDDPDFKYRVGDLFLKENSLNNAAKFGRFSGVSWGDIKQQDYSWVKYPRVDDRYYFDKKREYSQFQDKEIREIEITLENSLKLVESPIFRSIENLELNFYYYSYSKETFVQLHTEKVENTFQGGVRDHFAITIQNPPRELLEDSYMRHGEFIISEVKDFYIPELKISYRELLAGVKAKTVPLYRTTPFENDLNYVAVPKGGETFINVLSHLYPEKFEIKSDQVTQIEQFSNNLPSFKYLHELKGEDKTGHWYVMTNPLKQHFLKHRFTNSDSITLSYVTGDELSKRVSEITPSFRKSVFSEDKEKKLPLGNISNNSEVSLSLYLNSLKGVELVSKPGRFSYAPRCSGNCTGTNWNVWAKFVHNTFRSFQTPREITSFEQIAPAFDLYINNTRLNLENLIKENLATLSLKEADSGNYLNIHIKGLQSLDLIQSGQENLAFLKIRPLSIGQTGEGIQINDAGGKNIDPKHHAGLICLQEAAKRKVPLAVTSYAFKSWESKVPWGQPDRRTGYKPVRGQKKKYYDGVVLDVVSKITNFYN